MEANNLDGIIQVHGDDGAQHCCSVCLSGPACAGFVLYGDSCYLKTAVWNTVPLEGRVTYSRRVPPSSPPVIAMLANLESCTRVADPTCLVRSWTVFGDLLWWLPYVDGWAHRWGAAAFDGTAESQENGQDGRVSAYLRATHDHFRSTAAWGAASGETGAERQSDGALWSSSRALWTNQMLRGCGEGSTSSRRCVGLFTTYTPRHTNDGIADSRVHGEGVVSVFKPGDWEQVQVDVPAMLDTAFANYSRELADAVARSPPLWADYLHPRRAFGGVLRPLSWLFAYLAELHPFPDANSRTRNFILQTSLLRAGGHLLLLPDNGWVVYQMSSFEQLENFLLGGWCAYEYYRVHDASPYLQLSRTGAAKAPEAGGAAQEPPKAHGQGTLTDEALAIGRLLYNATEDVCRVQAAPT